MAVKHQSKPTKAAPVVTITAKRPRVLIVGGEAKNFKGTTFGEKFDHEIHLKDDGNSLSGVKGKFDAVVGLPWITPTLSRNAKAWAKEHDIPFIESPKVGQIEYWLGKQLKWAAAYFKDFDRKPKGDQEIAAQLLPTPEEAPPTAVLWDEDQLWSAYGEAFVQQLKGLDGETTDRKTFVDLMQDETGLRGEPVEILIAILRRQGVIAEHDGVVSIGVVNPVDIEKRKKFIESQKDKRAPFNNGGGSIRDEVREALSDDGEEDQDGQPHFGITNDELMVHFERLEPGATYKKMQDLFDALTRTGLLRDGKPFSSNSLRGYLTRLEDAGEVVRNRAGYGFSFKVRLPKREKPIPEVKPAHPPTPVVIAHPPPPKPVPAPVGPPPGVLTAKPFADAFGPVQEAHAELPFPVPPEEKDISKEGVLYEMLEQTYPNKRMPELGGLVIAVKAFRGLFYETAWDTSAAKGILIRLKLPTSDPNQKRAMSRRNDFTDDEWSYFALEYLRDQTLFSLLPLIDNTNRVWRVCGTCDKHFYFTVPMICYDCREDNRRFVGEAKGGTP